MDREKTPGENEGVREYDLGMQWHIRDVQTFRFRVLTHDCWHFIQTFGGYVWGPRTIVLEANLILYV